MNTKRFFTTIRLLILSSLAGSLILSGCGSAQPTNTAIPPTQEPTSALPPTSTTDPYATWSTNFANVADPAASGIFNHGTNPSISLETTDVPSGGKAVKFTATVGKAYAQQMGPSFQFAGLTGVNTIDLSDKTLKLEVFVPQGSPLHYFYVDVSNNTQQFVCVRFFESDLYLGQWHTYTADVSMDITLKAWHQSEADASPNLTDDQAVQVLKHAQDIFIIAMNTQDYPSTEAYFEMDSLGWAPSDPMPAYDASVDSLRKFAPASLPMGGFIERNDIYDPDLVRSLVQEFNLIRSANQFPQTEPAGDVMTYDASWSPKASEDYMHDAYGMAMFRDTGLWLNSSQDVPEWLTKKSYEETKLILEGYIRGLVEHYKGQTYIWNVFNELLRYDLQYGNYTGLGLKTRDQTPLVPGTEYASWSQDPSDLSLIEDAFRVAHEADPQALLVFVDTGLFNGPAEADALYALVAKMKADGTPIDGVGFETHEFIGQVWPNPGVHYDPVNGFAEIGAQVDRFAALGVKVIFAEADVPIYLADIDPATPHGQALLAQRRQEQAIAYRDLLHVALTNPDVIGFVTFDWQDEYTYTDPALSQVWPGYGKDLGLFDQFFQKKPAYGALLNELKGSTLPGWSTKLEPVDASDDQTSAPLLQWSTTWDATGYEFCVDTSDNNTCDASWVSAGTDTQAALSGLAVDTTYYWQVRARNADGATEADNSTWWSFKVSSAANQAPGQVLFQDDFTGALGADWQWTNENKSAWSLTNKPGWLQIIARKGGIGDNAENLLLRPAPQGNFELETSLSFKPNGNFQSAGLVIYESPSQFLKFSHAYCAVGIGVCLGDGIYFDLVTNGTQSGSNFATPAPASGLVYLRLRREGNNFTAYMSADGTTWTKVGEHQDDIHPGAVGLIAGGTTTTTPVPAQFDYFITYGLP